MGIPRNLFLSVGSLGIKQRNVGRFVELKERINQRREKEKEIAVQWR